MKKNYRLFYKTILDIGLKRFIGRIIYEIRKKFDENMPEFLVLYFADAKNKTPLFKKELNNLILKTNNHWLNKKDKNEISFTFLNQKEYLTFPIEWNNLTFTQLWRFNLHYFDWARKFLDYRINNGFWSKDSRVLKILIDDWIENNKLGKGDGWHSYTISLRIRNWILIIRSCPEFDNQKYIDSIWLQICWLYSHKENYLGGNHWLENLISLLVGSLQFEGAKAKKIFLYSSKELEKELKLQILEDGGHQERSASYHLLILERLIELGLIIENIKSTRPTWLVEVIRKMTEWAISIRLNNGNHPLFNDSPNISSPIDEVLNYSRAYLNRFKLRNKGIFTKLTEMYSKNGIENNHFLMNNKLTSLFDTGWSIIRLDNGIEVLFKFGDSCPKHLPAHAHSDLLSIDIIKDGKPIILETGTSNYGLNPIREYERSSAAHNVFQLGLLPRSKKQNINWIEPIETWGNFRAARKAKILNKSSSINTNGNIFLKGSHDAYERFGAKYSRSINLAEKSNGDISLIILDEVICQNSMCWRQFWHLAPNQSSELFNRTIEDLKLNYDFKKEWIDTYYSYEFGRKINRKSLKLTGKINPGFHKFKSTITISND